MDVFESSKLDQREKRVGLGSLRDRKRFSKTELDFNLGFTDGLDLPVDEVLVNFFCFRSHDEERK